MSARKQKKITSEELRNKLKLKHFEARRKISLAAQKQMSRFKGVDKVKRVSKLCLNCKKEFKY